MLLSLQKNVSCQNPKGFRSLSRNVQKNFIFSRKKNKFLLKRFLWTRGIVLTSEEFFFLHFRLTEKLDFLNFLFWKKSYGHWECSFDNIVEKFFARERCVSAHCPKVFTKTFSRWKNNSLRKIFLDTQNTVVTTLPKCLDKKPLVFYSMTEDERETFHEKFLQKDLFDTWKASFDGPAEKWKMKRKKSKINPQNVPIDTLIAILAIRQKNIPWLRPKFFRSLSQNIIKISFFWKLNFFFKWFPWTNKMQFWKPCVELSDERPITSRLLSENWRKSFSEKEFPKRSTGRLESKFWQPRRKIFDKMSNEFRSLSKSDWKNTFFQKKNFLRIILRKNRMRVLTNLLNFLW